MYNQVRIIHSDGNASVRHLSFSQTIELLTGLSREQRKAFWQKQETTLPSGDSAYLVFEGA